MDGQSESRARPQFDAEHVAKEIAENPYLLDILYPQAVVFGGVFMRVSSEDGLSEYRTHLISHEEFLRLYPPYPKTQIGPLDV